MRIRLRRRMVGRRLVGRRVVEPSRDHWSQPPVRIPLDPTVRVRVIGSEQVARGLAEVWDVRDHRPDFTVVEYDGRSGLGDPVAGPYVVWATASGPPAAGTDAIALVTAADAVFVADPDQLAAWQVLVPDATLLAPAASARVLPRRERSGVAVAGAERLAPEVAGLAATVVNRALPTLEPNDDVASAAVFADGLRRSVHDTWTLLDAAAAGTPVVSPGLPAPVPVAGATTEQTYRAELVARLQQPELRDREGLAARRAVLEGHTWAHRAQVIAEAVGLDTASLALGRLDHRLSSVSAIVPTNRAHELDNVLANIGGQRHAALELVLVLHGIDVDVVELRKRAADAGVAHLELVTAPSSYTLGACLNAGIDAASGAYLAKMDDDNHYGSHYLTDLLHGFETSGAGIVGKWAHYVWLQSTGAVVLRYPDAEYSYQRRIQGGSMLFEGDLLRSLRFGDLPRAVDSDVLDRALADGVKVWSGDRFNYVSIRGVDRTSHTWTVEDATFLTASGRLEFYGDPRAQVEV
jgi:hypothetical protein